LSRPPLFVAPIVEGFGEVEAVPKLLRRIAQTLPNCAGITVNPPWRVKAGSFLNDAQYFNDRVEFAARKARQSPRGCVLILLDCEDDCPAELGPELLAKARACRSDIPIEVTLAYREFETWFLAAAHSLRGVAGLSATIEPPADPESIRNAKGWLSTHMATPYNPPEHQPLMTANFSMTEAARVPSFARLLKKLAGLLSNQD
jgi:hypothetical protein